MSDTKDGMEIEPDDAEDKEVLLADPDDYHRAQRLREIHERHRRVYRVLDEIERMSSNHTKQKLNLADAVAAYIAEVEQILHDADREVELPENFPFENIDHYATNIGEYYDEDGNHTIASYRVSLSMFRRVKNTFEKVKPLIEPDDADEWDV